MITVSDVIEVSDYFCRLEALDAITFFGILELGERHEDPEMITHIMDLAARERKEVMQEFSEKLEAMKTAVGI